MSHNIKMSRTLRVLRGTVMTEPASRLRTQRTQLDFVEGKKALGYLQHENRATT